MQGDILSTIVEHRYGFKMEYSLIANYGIGYFFSKWKEVDEPSGDTITDEIGYHWTCLYFEIGKDISKEAALKDFNRDSESFDVDVYCKVIKCDIVLLDEYIIGSDYAYVDGSAQELLKELVGEYSYKDDMINSANEKLLELVENME